jgi:hypothetical protein
MDRIVANSVLSPDSFYNGTPCWIWTGKRVASQSGFQYPVMTMRVKGKVKNVRVHRIVSECTGKDVAMHLCNNTLCVSPHHLQAGTQAENIQQCVAEGRHVSNL